MLWAGFFGNPGASWLTAAVAAFLAAGEFYHRAWRGSGQPSRFLTRKGDVLSGLGALALTLSLLFCGNAAMAVLSGLLLAVGKFGNAALPGGASGGRLAAMFRHAALLSRVFVLAALAPELLEAAVRPAAAEAGPTALGLVLVLRTLICCRGDFLLLRGR
ncbi:hypothetical protein [Mangrovicoccus ximenensis]|uniref:hypothetical protein n=1 Tax=Mangrovicoccus ximenensis TaxID=1911570 RepID=UPI000D37F042|nr:hypothetical protein [Mangrovicoccus ximenensis]